MSLNSCLVDLRTKSLKNNEINQNKAIVNEWIKKLQKSHHYNEWKKIDYYSLKVNDKFFGLIGKATNPFPNNPITFDAIFDAHSFNSKIQLEHIKNKEIWGLFNSKSYKQVNNESISNKRDKKIEFWLPTYQYFFELPHKIQEADILLNSGKAKFNDQSYQLIYATWKNAEPNKEFDQYILWINENTNLIDMVQFTIREKGKFLKGAAIYTKYETVNGLVLPAEIEIKQKITNKKLIHNIQYHQFKKLDTIPNLNPNN